MCGRYTLTVSLLEIEKELAITTTGKAPPFPWHARFNIAPTQTLPVVLCKDGARALEWMRWGLIPSWAKDPSIGNKMINARGETAAEKPAFRNAMKKRRCLVPADGFYEWKKTGKIKTPLWIHPRNRKIFCLAGLWESWHSEKGEVLESFTVLTTEANEFMKTIHDRMPVILSQRDEDKWLDPDLSTAALKKLIHPYSEHPLDAHPVSRIVNSPSNDVPECIVATPETPFSDEAQPRLL